MPQLIKAAQWPWVAGLTDGTTLVMLLLESHTNVYTVNVFREKSFSGQSHLL
jgi:hypothetical protein